MRLNPLLRQVADQSHLFDVVPVDEVSGCAGVGWRFRNGEGIGQVDFLAISRSLTLDISDFRCFEEKRMALARSSAPHLKLRFKLSGCSLLQFKSGGAVSLLGEHCSASVYSPNDLQHESLTRDVAERSVTLHCNPDFFLDDLGLTPDATPTPIRAFLRGQSIPHSFQRARLSARMRQATIDLMRPQCPPQLARAFREVKARDLALSLLILLCEGEERSGQSRPSGKRRLPSLASHELRRATDWLHENLSDDADMTSLARVLGMDPIHFARAFKQSTGMSPGQYRESIRHQHSGEV